MKRAELHSAKAQRRDSDQAEALISEQGAGSQTTTPFWLASRARLRAFGLLLVAAVRQVAAEPGAAMNGGSFPSVLADPALVQHTANASGELSARFCASEGGERDLRIVVAQPIVEYERD